MILTCCVAGMTSSVAAATFLGAGALRRMLSKLSFLSTRNSGCLNSQAYDCQSASCQGGNLANIHLGRMAIGRFHRFV
jgi:hypothetical protein